MVQEQNHYRPFSQYVEEAQAQFDGNEVKAIKITEDQSPYKLVYEPGHPDADEDGYVQLPNVDRLRKW